MPALPLDQLQITHKDLKTGKLRTSPALHPEQKADRYFVLYKPPPKDNIPALVEEYLERATFVANDLDWLLALPHDKFWCQVIFDETLQKCLDSYLHYVPRKFDEWVAPAPEVVDMQKRLHRSVFLTFLRMSTHKESKDHFISPSAFGEILYNNFLFDIPKILDLCVLFGKGNSSLLKKMIGNIFIQQPSYYNDLDETMPTILQVFSNILQHSGLQRDGTSSIPQKLEERGRLTPSDMPLLELKDIVLYLCDTCTTLWAFLEIFPLACQTFQKHDFCYRLASFYEIAIPELESAIKKRRLEDSKLLGDLWQRLSHSRKKLLEIFHILLNQICLLPVPENSCDNIQGFVEEFLQIFSSLLQEKRQVKPDPTPLLTSRHNVFQNDEFDVFSRDSVDLSRVHKGRRKEENTRSLVNDKREVVAQRQRYEQYSVVVEEVPLQPGESLSYRGDDYEDEYDDTYDGNQVGANDADSDDELISRRPFTIPQVLRTKVPREGQEEDDDDEEEAEDEAPKPDHFVQDPAVLREKAEARRMAFLARKGYRHDNTAVASSSRGHGQSRETTQERRKKEANKSTRANHNRRTMADRKRNKGMIPS
ncbi:activating signal cointegrator 1 complex subunit 2 isoform X5 [Molossus molossus]|uniref:activating signal cointegrator 1 complex subunit 2 isoform X5 n=1 Tax=Molossus molossus TaxID=27622 RepID=UPI001747094D|nr:activating signal cointegrator 1 complex subunit 2 isoform X5 [Molossus molossus]